MKFPVCARGRRPRGRLRLFFQFLYAADKADAFARDCAHELLLLTAVANGLAHRVDTAVEGGIRDDATAPYRRNEVVFADDAITVFDQVDQKVEYLRLD
jgi:hypothetical protein